MNRMDARTYLDTHGEPGAQALIAAVVAAGGKCTVGYFKQIAYGYRRPSFELGKLMVENDQKRALDLDSLMAARKSKKDAGPPASEGSRAAQ
jgi:hypothetical protein